MTFFLCNAVETQVSSFLWRDVFESMIVLIQNLKLGPERVLIFILHILGVWKDNFDWKLAIYQSSSEKFLLPFYFKWYRVYCCGLDSDPKYRYMLLIGLLDLRFKEVLYYVMINLPVWQQIFVNIHKNIQVGHGSGWIRDKLASRIRIRRIRILSIILGYGSKDISESNYYGSTAHFFAGYFCAAIFVNLEMILSFSASSWFRRGPSRSPWTTCRSGPSWSRAGFRSRASSYRS